LELIHIGHSSKSRGVNGNFKARVEQQYIADVLRARAVFINLNGSKVPFLIEHAEDRGTVLLKLEEIDSPEDVSALLSKELYLESSEVSAELLNTTKSQNGLIGFQLKDQNGTTIGIIEEILEYPDQLLAGVAYQSKKVLIPIHEDLIVSMDESKSQIVLTIVDGLLDL